MTARIARAKRAVSILGPSRSRPLTCMSFSPSGRRCPKGRMRGLKPLVFLRLTWNARGANNPHRPAGHLLPHTGRRKRASSISCRPEPDADPRRSRGRPPAMRPVSVGRRRVISRAARRKAVAIIGARRDIDRRPVRWRRGSSSGPSRCRRRRRPAPAPSRRPWRPPERTRARQGPGDAEPADSAPATVTTAAAMARPYRRPWPTGPDRPATRARPSAARDFGTRMKSSRMTFSSPTENDHSIRAGFGPPSGLVRTRACSADQAASGRQPHRPSPARM